MQVTYAYCWRSGLIEFGLVVPDGAIRVAASAVLDEEGLKGEVGARARHGWDGSLLVPGIPEAESDAAAWRALAAWLDWSGADQRDPWSLAEGDAA